MSYIMIKKKTFPCGTIAENSEQLRWAHLAGSRIQSYNNAALRTLKCKVALKDVRAKIF